MLLGSLLLLAAAVTAAQGKGQQAGSQKLEFQVKLGECSYAFYLPQHQPCIMESSPAGAPCWAQKTQSLTMRRQLSAQQMETLESALRNSTQRLQKLETYIQAILRPEVRQPQHNIVQSHMSPVELSTSLLNHTGAQTLKLPGMMAQLSHMEHKMLETSITTDKLEQQLQKQRGMMDKLHEHNSDLETRLDTLETGQKAQVVDLHSQKESILQQLEENNSRLVHIRQGLEDLHSNSSLLQQQQQQLLQSLKLLKQALEQSPGAAVQTFQDCEDIRKTGLNTDGVYTIFAPSLNQIKRVFCVMDTDGPAWTVIQRRVDGTVNFQRKWQAYKEGFGDPAGEYWLGNEVVHQLTSSKNYSLHVMSEDWDGNKVFANFGHFQLESEEQFYRIFLDKMSDAATRRGFPILKNSTFSTIDADHDNCPCNCASIMSGGWWFDACGISNLNGIYYPVGQHKNRMNGIRWDHTVPGSHASLRASRMMIRPIRT